ncbi:TetR/AcrR family transcriptional regulator [uncultured Friedmanniella sp.]|uniref:TetR/AcrR family transcriptional regulator n=1 Tax=uncultured Friedmanniella sp. TaxID=335381 RepID=UPI0035C95EC0
MPGTAREPNPRGAGDQLRHQLVDAAGELLLHPQEVALPSLRAVARACSVSPAAVYLHFDSSAALIEAVLDDQLDALSATMRAALVDAPAPIDRLRAFAAAYVGWGLEHPGAYQLLFETADRWAGGSRAVAHERWDLLHETSRLLGDVLGGPTDPALAFRLWALLHGLVSLRLHKADVDWPTQPVADAHGTVDDLLRGINTD